MNSQLCFLSPEKQQSLKIRKLPLYEKLAICVKILKLHLKDADKEAIVKKLDLDEKDIYVLREEFSKKEIENWIGYLSVILKRDTEEREKLANALYAKGTLVKRSVNMRGNWKPHKKDCIVEYCKLFQITPHNYEKDEYKQSIETFITVRQLDNFCRLFSEV